MGSITVWSITDHKWIAISAYTFKEGIKCLSRVYKGCAVRPARIGHYSLVKRNKSAQNIELALTIVH